MLVPLLVIYRVIWHTCTTVYKSLEVLRLCILGGGGRSMMTIGGCEYWSVRGGDWVEEHAIIVGMLIRNVYFK